MDDVEARCRRDLDALASAPGADTLGRGHADVPDGEALTREG
jgi:hypothetical protein